MKAADIEDYVRWFTAEREWENWDAPWEKEEADEASVRKTWTEYYETVRSMADDELRWRFELEHEGGHIGWLSSYYMDEDCNWIAESDVKDGQKVLRAIGADICESSAWGAGIGTKAFEAFIAYYFERGYEEIYTQTWSGNLRMIRCAEKLGFREFCRKTGQRTVNGRSYDGLTFILTKEKA